MKRDVTMAGFDLPESENIEGRLLYEIITEPSYIMEVRRIVESAMFSTPGTRKSYDTVLEMFDNGETVDFETVIPKLPSGAFKKISSHATDQYNGGVVEHAESLREVYIKRLAYFSAMDLLNGINEGCSVDAILNKANTLRDGAMLNYHNSASLLKDLVNEVGEDLEKENASKIPTGIKPLDFLFYRGLDGGDLVILAARPGIGKTTLALQMARYNANIGNKSIIFSMEMSKKQIAKRILLASGELSSAAMFGGKVDWAAFERAVAATNGANITVNDESRSVNEICSTITSAHQKGECAIAFIDYLGLIDLPGDRSGSATISQLIGKITKALKHCATRNNIPIVLLCQLNRQSVSEKRSPILNDLRDSGSIEQDADRVIMLERPDLGGEGNYIDLWLRKNRNGKGGDVCIHMKGDSNYANFVEYAE